ncbi:MAG TPA: hypothetical protein VK966_01065 [Longimicrobiales bacterium]|nr:hypothetical protein [Longimicrobiales bacterium]
MRIVAWATAALIAGLLIGAHLGYVAGVTVLTGHRADLVERHGEMDAATHCAAAVGVTYAEAWQGAALRCVEARYGEHWTRTADRRGP